MQNVVPVLGVLIWVVLVYTVIRWMTATNATEKERALGHELQSAAWSDKYVELLLDRHPHSTVLLRQHVANARDRKDWPEALRRAEVFVKHVRSAEAWLCHADVLRAAGRPDEAEAIVNRLHRRHPFNPDVTLHWARAAQARSDWNRSARRFAAFRRRAPRRPEGYTEGAAALLHLGRRDDAIAVISAGLRQCPDSTWIAHRAASFADDDADPAVGVEAWVDFRARFPNEVSGYTCGAASLARAGRHDEAEQLLVAANGFFPGNGVIAKAIADHAARREREAA